MAACDFASAKTNPVWFCANPWWQHRVAHEGEAIAACQATCEAHADCGGFLYYTQSGRFALKNATCIDDVGPLPPSDAGDDLFVLRSFPQPAPLPAKGGVVSTVQVCVADASEDLGPSTDESYSVSVDGDGTTKVAAR